MPTEKQLKVQVLAVTPEAEKLCAVAAKQCYNAVDATEIYQDIAEQEKVKLLSHCIRSGHLSILEHPSLTVAVSGCSRSFLAQITRHRHLSFSVQSQHYISHSDFGFIVPNSLCGKLENFYTQNMELDQEFYNSLIECGIPPHDARQVLPNAVEARMVVSGNFRAWFEFLQKRLCKRNTEEILLFSQRLREILVDIAPTIFSQCGAPCQTWGCRELRPCGEPYEKAGD